MTKEINHRSAQLKPHHLADDLIPDGHQVAVYLRKCWSVMTDALVLLIFRSPSILLSSIYAGCYGTCISPRIWGKCSSTIFLTRLKVRFIS